MPKETAAADRLYEACHHGAQVDLPGLLDWLADRLVHVYGESPNVDFVRTAKDRAKRLRLAMDIYEAERRANV